MSNYLLHHNFLSSETAQILHKLGIPKRSYSYWYDSSIIHNPTFYEKNRTPQNELSICSAFTPAELLDILQFNDPTTSRRQNWGVRLHQDEIPEMEYNIKPMPEILASLIISRINKANEIGNQKIPSFMEVNKLALIR